VTDDQILSAIGRYFEDNDNGYLVCPHTATAVNYHYENPTE
jgi:threonine synthase